MDEERILDIRMRSRECYAILFDHVITLNRFINFTAVIFLILIVKTVCKYPPYFKGINLAVIVSWTVEGLWAVSLLVRDFMDAPRFQNESFLFHWLQVTNIVLLVIIIFRLKTIQIYMEGDS